MPSQPASTRRRTSKIVSDPSFAAGHVAAMAARSLIDDATIVADARRLDAVDRSLSAALADPDALRADILDASPFVVERSGRVRTLVEMIEDDEAQGAERLRLAMLLLRAIEWTSRR